MIEDQHGKDFGPRRVQQHRARQLADAQHEHLQPTSGKAGQHQRQVDAESVAFLGETQHVQIRAGTEPVHARIAGRKPLEANTNVFVEFAAELIVVIS